MILCLHGKLSYSRTGKQCTEAGKWYEKKNKAGWIERDKGDLDVIITLDTVARGHPSGGAR